MRTLLTEGGAIQPRVMYGTAWKKDDTRPLVERALAAGFRAFDTANQRKHYHEEAVGEALAAAYAAGTVRREELFLQTKFTHVDGQDDRLPYERSAPIATQVKQSFASSLANLRTSTVDAYLLHAPSARRGLAPADVDAWRAMEEIHAAGGARALGVSNVTREQLEVLLGRAKVQPSFVQNRCHATKGWDRDVRELCREHGIVYQGFSLLTANARVLEAPTVREIGTRLGLTPAQVVFCFARAAGMLPLTGTTSAEHMKHDLDAVEQALTDADVRAVEAIAGWWSSIAALVRTRKG